MNPISHQAEVDAAIDAMDNSKIETALSAYRSLYKKHPLRCHFAVRLQQEVGALYSDAVTRSLKNGLEPTPILRQKLFFAQKFKETILPNFFLNSEGVVAKVARWQERCQEALRIREQIDSALLQQIECYLSPTTAAATRESLLSDHSLRALVARVEKLLEIPRFSSLLPEVAIKFRKFAKNATFTFFDFEREIKCEILQYVPMAELKRLNFPHTDLQETVLYLERSSQIRTYRLFIQLCLAYFGKEEPIKQRLEEVRDSSFSFEDFETYLHQHHYLFSNDLFPNYIKDRREKLLATLLESSLQKGYGAFLSHLAREGFQLSSLEQLKECLFLNHFYYALVNHPDRGHWGGRWDTSIRREHFADGPTDEQVDLALTNPNTLLNAISSINLEIFQRIASEVRAFANATKLILGQRIHSSRDQIEVFHHFPEMIVDKPLAPDPDLQIIEAFRAYAESGDIKGALDLYRQMPPTRKPYALATTYLRKLNFLIFELEL
jgi:hypothetical protein